MFGSLVRQAEVRFSAPYSDADHVGSRSCGKIIIVLSMGDANRFSKISFSKPVLHGYSKPITS